MNLSRALLVTTQTIDGIMEISTKRREWEEETEKGTASARIK
uniref:Uncharacterized protein n=1 Tax=Setaria digitata TaxID=48799 RepID=A0A915Q116_9BILA